MTLLKQKFQLQNYLFHLNYFLIYNDKKLNLDLIVLFFHNREKNIQIFLIYIDSYLFFYDTHHLDLNILLFINDNSIFKLINLI